MARLSDKFEYGSNGLRFPYVRHIHVQYTRKGLIYFDTQTSQVVAVAHLNVDIMHSVEQLISHARFPTNHSSSALVAILASDILHSVFFSPS